MAVLRRIARSLAWPGGRTTAALAVLVAGVLVLRAAPAAAQGGVDVVRGRVTDDSARAVANAPIHVTRGPDRLVKQTTTDSTGSFLVRFEDGTGDYLVAVSAPGFRPARRRVQRQQSERELVADFVLGRDLSVLAAVRVQAQRPTRANNNVSPYSTEPGSAEKWSDGVEGQLSPAIAGDLNALAGTVPGVTMIGGAPSILGSGAESNLTTLNGMGLPANAIPRAARTETRITGTTYDATRGGFAGANIDVRLGPGSRDFQRRDAFLTLDAPQLQFTDAVGRSLGVPSNGMRGSVGMDGELIRRALTYNVALDFARSTSDPATLLGADEATLLRAGIAPDSVARLVQVATPLGLPLSGTGVPSARERNSLTWLGRLDDTRDSLNRRTLTSYAGYTRQGALGFGPLAAPSAGGQQRERFAGGQLVVRDFLGAGRRVLNEARASLSGRWSDVTPYRDQPGATVLVRSAALDARRDVTALTLGGSPFLASDEATWSAEAANETNWNARGTRHRFKALLWGRADGLEQQAAGNRLGSYAFNSIEDLAAGRAASFSRTLTQPDRAGSAWNGAAAFAHQWVPSRFFSLIYGARVEANGFGDAPPTNAALERALGVRTGVAPTRLHVSPRVGFSYTYNRDKDNGNGSSQNSVGRFYRTTMGVLRGGIGEFRDLLRPGVLADASASTGLAGGTELLSCVGAAVPIPDWSRFLSDPGSLPTACVGGGGVLGERAPAVTLIDPAYDVPRTWRASLEWQTNFGKWMVRVNGLGTYDLSQPGTFDANFGGTPRFSMDAEGGRPVFVSAAGIDAASGAVSAAESRRSAEFGRVGVRRSDLRGYGGQLTFTVSPDLFRMRRIPGQLFVSGAYTVQGARRQYRGFDGAGFGDPREREWAPAANDARHIAILQSGFSTRKTGTVTLFARAQSGTPFTPLVQGDVNGDGRSSDRAFVPDAAREGAAGDAALATQLRALLDGGSGTARRCLEAYAGRVADRNGCRAPWTQSLNLQWRPPIRGTVGRRVTAAVYFQNVLGGLDQLVNGADLRGWGTQATPDPILLVPRGFDAAARRFRYDVNPRFGDTRGARTLSREPFRITMDFTLNFAVNYDVQQLRRALEPVRVARGGWERRSSDSLAAFYLQRTSNLHAMMLAESDSLFLSRAQIAAFRQADSVFSERVRAVYGPLGEYLSQFSDGVAGKAALDSVAASQRAYWKIFWAQPEIADSLITPTQRELMPMLKSMLQVPRKDREQSQWYFGNPVKFKAAAKPVAATGGGDE